MAINLFQDEKELRGPPTHANSLADDPFQPSRPVGPSGARNHSAGNRIQHHRPTSLIVTESCMLRRIGPTDDHPTSFPWITSPSSPPSVRTVPALSPPGRQPAFTNSAAHRRQLHDQAAGEFTMMLMVRLPQDIDANAATVTHSLVATVDLAVLCRALPRQAWSPPMSELRPTFCRSTA